MSQLVRGLSKVADTNKEMSDFATSRADKLEHDLVTINSMLSEKRFVEFPGETSPELRVSIEDTNCTVDFVSASLDALKDIEKEKDEILNERASLQEDVSKYKRLYEGEQAKVMSIR